MGHVQVERALADMAAVDPVRAGVAESVLDRLTAGKGIEVIDLAGVLRFAWYELPVKWLVSADEHRRALDAAADLFDRLGFPRYAERCRSPLTEHIHAAYERSPAEGFEAFREAYRRSGIDPPDLEDFSWGDVMGREEAVARTVVERALEDAMAEGRFTVGARGWRQASAAVTAAALDSPHAELPGQTHRTAILTERLDMWLQVAEKRSPRLHSLRNRHVNRLLAPIAPPRDVVERLGPVTWFLDRVGDGIRLTQAGYLPTAMVQEGSERFGWVLPWTDRPGRRESEVGELFELHGLLRRIRAVHVRHNTLRLSPRGREMRDDAVLAWRVVATGLASGEWYRAVAEVLTLLLLDGERPDEELEDEAAIVLAEYGWQIDGKPLDPLTISVSWSYTARLLSVLGGAESSGDWRSRTTRLTEFGEATLLEQIRAEATGPSAW